MQAQSTLILLPCSSSRSLIWGHPGSLVRPNLMLLRYGCRRTLLRILRSARPTANSALPPSLPLTPLVLRPSLLLTLLDMTKVRVFVSNSSGCTDLPTQSMLQLVPEPLRPERLPKVESDLRTTVCSRLLLLRALVPQTLEGQRVEGDLKLTHTQYGRPHIAKDPNTDFNLSHQGLWCAVGWVQGAPRSWCIGVDIVDNTQGQDAPSRHLASLKPYLTLKEYTYLSTLTPVAHQLTQTSRIWGAKEAYAKALGLGLSMALNRLEVTLLEVGVVFK